MASLSYVIKIGHFRRDIFISSDSRSLLLSCAFTSSVFNGRGAAKLNISAAQPNTKIFSTNMIITFPSSIPILHAIFPHSREGQQAVWRFRAQENQLRSRQLSTLVPSPTRLWRSLRGRRVMEWSRWSARGRPVPIQTNPSAIGMMSVNPNKIRSYSAFLQHQSASWICVREKIACIA